MRTRFRIELPGSVPDGDILLGGGVTVAFLCVQMEQSGALHVLQLSQDAHDFLHVVPVEWSEIADVQSFENVLLVADGRFQCVAQSDDAVAAVIL